MPRKTKTDAAAPVLSVPLDAAAEVQRLRAEAAAARAEADAAKAEAAAARAEAEAEKKRAAEAAAAATGGKGPGLHRMELTAREKATPNLIGRAFVMMPNGRRWDMTAKRGTDGRVYIREDYERRFVSDGKGGKRPTSGLDCDVPSYGYVKAWQIENPTILADQAAWGADMQALADAQAAGGAATTEAATTTAAATEPAPF